MKLPGFWWDAVFRFGSVVVIVCDRSRSSRFMGTPPCFSHIFTKGDNFAISCLLSWMTKPFKFGVNYRNNLKYWDR